MFSGKELSLIIVLFIFISLLINNLRGDIPGAMNNHKMKLVLAFDSSFLSRKSIPIKVLFKETDKASFKMMAGAKLPLLGLTIFIKNLNNNKEIVIKNDENPLEEKNKKATILQIEDSFSFVVNLAEAVKERNVGNGGEWEVYAIYQGEGPQETKVKSNKVSIHFSFGKHKIPNKSPLYDYKVKKAIAR